MTGGTEVQGQAGGSVALPAETVWRCVDQMVASVDAQALAASYAAAQPFPHAVLDDFVPPALREALSAEFPDPAGMSIQFKAKLQVKSAEQDWRRMGPVTRTALAAFNAGPFVEFVERLTGIAPLVSDPFLEGGGQHQHVRTGRLGVHADFMRSERLGLERRVNALVYLTPGWAEDWQGHLEFWDPTMTTCVRRIAPLYGRCVIFTTTSSSFHGVPEPLACPPGQTRRSLALYYYSTGLVEPGRPEHRAQFQRRPGSADPPVTALSEEGFSVGRMASALIPPILLGPARAAYRRLRPNRRGHPS